MNAVEKIEPQAPVSHLPVQSEAAAVLSIIERAARDPSVDIVKLQQLMEMRERITARTAESDFDKALTAAQSAMGRIRTDSHNREYGATREDEDEGLIRGYGHSRLAAIADLVWAISNTEEEEERNNAEFELDHVRDYRKHEVA